VVEHYNDTVGVTGSNPVPPTTFWMDIIQNPAGKFYVGPTAALDFYSDRFGVVFPPMERADMLALLKTL
jgi:hypothetical protein